MKHKVAKNIHLAGVLVAIFTLVGAGLVQPASAVPGDYNWQQASARGSSVGMPLWTIASSADGAKLVAGMSGGSIYTSANSGVTWTERPAAGSRQWLSIASSADGSKLAAVESSWNGSVTISSIYTSADSGVTWTERPAAGSREWQSIASSADGSKLVAVESHFTGVDYAGSIYTSADSGVTWTERPAAGSRHWRSVSSSADGNKLAVVVDQGYIYTSTDSGATWTERTTANWRQWSSIASSYDGTKLIAIVGVHRASSGGYGWVNDGLGFIYTSSDSGATWTEQTSAGSRQWLAVASSSDGTKLATVVYNGSVYTSADSGATWTERTVAGAQYLSLSSISMGADGTNLAVARNYGFVYTSTDSGANWTKHAVTDRGAWRSIVSSSDGTKLVLAEYNGSVYTSTDSGATWTERPSAGSRQWWSVASSSDGSKLTAVVYNGSVYTSTDSGATWTERPSAGSRQWQSVASSSDGSKLTAVVYDGSVYTSTDSGVTWIERLSAGSRQWASVDSSANGVNLLAGVDGGSLYLSTDSGATWSPVGSLNSAGGWFSLAMSPDGATLFAADAYGSDGNGGYAYISKDGGSTWQEQTILGLRYWSDWSPNTGAISADGETIAIADPYGTDWNDWNGGYIYVTHDSGTTWQSQVSAGGREWMGITMSSDGSKIAAGVDGGYIYLGNLEPAATASLDLASLPAGNKDATAAPAIAQASLAATSMACYTITPGSVSTLGPDSLVVPESGVSLLGGVAFSLGCTSTGGTANTSLTLGTSYADVSKLRVYKRSGTGPLIDVTKSVTIQNESGKTVIRYTLTDGGTWDEDTTTNSTIVDPIYVGLAGDGELASTGMSAGMIAVSGITLLAAGLMAMFRTTRRFRLPN